jgi:hypothetical protein
MSPASAPPSGNAALTAVTVRTRCDGSTASAANAMKFGIAPPSPRPVMRRASTSAVRLPAIAVHNEQTPITSIEPINTCRRPTRSDRRPPTTAPTNKPTVTALNTQDDSTAVR